MTTAIITTLPINDPRSLPIWAFAAHVDRYSPTSLTGHGEDEEAALREALSRYSGRVDYIWQGYHYDHGVTPRELTTLHADHGILGGKGGWVATYVWPYQDQTQSATVWIARGSIVPPLDGDQALAAEIRTRREAINLTQADLAEALNVTQATLSRWETGKVRVAHPGMVRWALIGLATANT